jgi:hypothetical protein
MGVAHMEPSLARGLLKQADKNVLEADLLVAGQWKVLVDLHSKGVDTSDAEARLDVLQRMQALCLVDRERLLAKLYEDTDTWDASSLES